VSDANPRAVALGERHTPPGRDLADSIPLIYRRGPLHPAWLGRCARASTLAPLPARLLDRRGPLHPAWLGRCARASTLAPLPARLLDRRGPLHPAWLGRSW